MDIYLIRHADALPLGAENVTEDGDRPLSDAGKAQCQALAAGLQRVGVRLDVLLTSPLLRARQTAEGMLGHWTEKAPRLVVCQELTLGGKTKKLARVLGDLTEGAVGLVGHQPDLCTHLGWLIGSKKAQLDLAKAGVAAVTTHGGVGKSAGVLRWLVTPEWFVG